MSGQTSGVVAAPLRIEAAAIRSRAGAPVVVTGMGPRRSQQAAQRLGDAPRLVAGFAGGLHPDVRPGDLVVADRLEGDGGGRDVAAGLLVAELRRLGLTVHQGTVASSPRPVTGRSRAEAAAGGALAADTESAWLVGTGAAAVVRAVVDTSAAELLGVRTPANAWRAWMSLRSAAPVLGAWAAAARPRQVLLAGPRSFCAGVERAIDIVERALQRYGEPLYVRRQIVHNSHVVAGLERRGAVFVDELDAVPDGATVVLAAHGVSPAVRAEAAGRDLHVIDATCPLVAKVHTEARRYAGKGYELVLIGHRDHDEIQGTLGEVAGIHLVEDPDDVHTIDPRDHDRIAYLTQTTLSTDEVAHTVARLKERFPAIVSPAADDICYATQNRQDAVKKMAGECDLVLVVGSANSSNSNRLVEVAERAGTTARLVDDWSDIRLEWLRDAATVGVTAGASAPEAAVEGVVAALASLGPVDVSERSVTTESVHFALPTEVR
ncbi:MAG TPA: 4-hydroxy-3-methylbut-2-enyl diphosphate reductase [Acidimicrobiales bacterium]|nr:4-hydroxy-3-methylbut-2-enyl diphosphate reductase [Acidimicrobiales bacterium]